MAKLIEPMRDIIGRAIYEDPRNDPEKDWYTLSEERREPWREDADRVIEAIKNLSYEFSEYAYSCEGADWLAITPSELWQEFFSLVQTTNGPRSVSDLTFEADDGSFK